MIEAAGLAYPRAPLDAALVQLSVGSLFDALVVASPEAGKFRLSVLGASLDLETALPLEIGERLRLAVKSTSPLTLELSPAPRVAADEDLSAPRGLPPDLEAAVRAIAAGSADVEQAARLLASRGLGLDPSSVRGLAALAARPGAAGEALVAAGAARQAPPPDGVAAAIRSFFLSPQLQHAADAALGAASAKLETLPGFRALVAEADHAAAAALRALPEAREGLALLDTGRALGDMARAIRVLNADAASRGDGVFYFAFGWAREGKPEGGFGRVEGRPGGAADPAAPARVLVTVEMTRLGLVQAAIALSGAAAAVTLAASPATRRLLERDRAGLSQALLNLGLKSEIRFSEDPPEPILPLSRNLDLRA